MLNSGRYIGPQRETSSASDPEKRPLNRRSCFADEGQGAKGDSLAQQANKGSSPLACRSSTQSRTCALRKLLVRKACTTRRPLTLRAEIPKLPEDVFESEYFAPQEPRGTEGLAEQAKALGAFDLRSITHVTARRPLGLWGSRCGPSGTTPQGARRALPGCERSEQPSAI